MSDTDDLSVLPTELKKLASDTKAAIAELQRKNDEALAEAKKGFNDVVRKEELDRVSTAISELKASFNDEVKALKRPNTTGGKDEQKTAEQVEYDTAFRRWFRKGYGEEGLRELERKAMSVGSDPDGGYTVIPEMESAIDATLKQVSPMRQLATVRTIGSSSYKKLVNIHGTTSGWVGETDARTTTATAKLNELEFPVMEIYANPNATQTLLDDSNINIEQWIADEVNLEFAYQEGNAFVLGNGVKKPWGFLGVPIVADGSYAWGSLGYVPSGAAGAFAASTPADAVISLYHALRTAYRGNASWVANNNTLGALRKLKDGQNNYLVVTNFSAGGVVESMMGKPVVEMVDMPDIGANSYSLAFGDFRRGYLIVDRIGIRVLRDPFTNKPFVQFYTTKRVGGGVQHYEAIKIMKFAVS